METTAAKVYLISSAVFLLVCHVWLNWRQAKPYMDELFHIPQALEFCSAVRERRWPTYHTSITTLPGAYLLPAFVSLGLQSDVLCQTRWLRALSAVTAWLCMPLLASISKQLGDRVRIVSADTAESESDRQSEKVASSNDNWSIAAILWLNPVFLFYSHLFYTDTSAMLWILVTWHLALREQHTASAITGIMATLMRQTNMVWHAFIVLDFAVHAISSNMDVMLRFVPMLSFLLRKVLPQVWCHACAGVLYVTFLVANGGVVLGDKTNHAVSIHYAMICYFLGFHAVSFGVLQLMRPRETLRSICAAVRSQVDVNVMAGISACLAAAVLATGDRVHPFVLADNRHYTFYVYRRWLLRSDIHRLSLVPLYSWAMVSTYMENTTRHCGRSDAAVQRARWREMVMDVVLLLCAACTLVPSALLEPRYLVMASTLLSLRRITRVRGPMWQPGVALMCAVLVAVNLGLIFVFAEMPFVRPVDAHMPEDDSPGRFMF